MILVTGGAGFIGSHFIEDWLAANNEPVVNIDKLTYAGNRANMAGFGPGHTFIQADIADHAAICALLSTYEPRAVINFAAESNVDRSMASPGDFVRTNIVGTYNLLECIREYWSRLSGKMQSTFRFLQVSTDEVYGSLEDGGAAFSETSPYRPNNPYSATKAAADHLVRSWHKTFGLPVLITNSCNNFGPRQHVHALIPRMIASALRGDSLPVYGDGLHRREWVYVKDNCAAIRTVLANGHLGEKYVVGGTKEIANLELVRILCRHLDGASPRPVSYETQITLVGDRPGHDRRYAVDDAKIRVELGWQPARPFDEAIHETVKWYVANQNRPQTEA